MEARIADREMGERAKRLPPTPRLVLNGMVILPQVDDDWVPVDDMWVLPGGRIVNTQQVEVIAEEQGWTLAKI